MAARRLRHQSLQLAAGGKNPRAEYPRGLKARFASARPPRLASYSQRAATAGRRGLHLWHHTQSRLRPYLPAAATRRRGRDGHCRQPEFKAAYAVRERQRKDSDEVFPACNMNTTNSHITAEGLPKNRPTTPTRGANRNRSRN